MKLRSGRILKPFSKKIDTRRYDYRNIEYFCITGLANRIDYIYKTIYAGLYEMYMYRQEFATVIGELLNYTKEGHMLNKVSAITIFNLLATKAGTTFLKGRPGLLEETLEKLFEIENKPNLDKDTRAIFKHLHEKIYKNSI